MSATPIFSPQSPSSDALTRPANKSDQLRRTAAVVADRDDVIQLASSLFHNPIEHIYQAICRSALREVMRQSLSVLLGCPADSSHVPPEKTVIPSRLHPLLPLVASTINGAIGEGVS